MSPARKISRHRSREVALQVLYAIDLARLRENAALVTGAAFDEAAANFEVPEAAVAFAKQLVCGVSESYRSIDELLSCYTRNWRLSRMAVVDRNILRLATYELTATTTPIPVVIDEAVELARRFGGDDSPAFVNGVLDAVARGLQDGTREREAMP